MTEISPIEKIENRLDRIEKRLSKKAGERRERRRACEKRIDRIEKKLRKRDQERELTLKERFGIHDRAQNFLRHFDEIMSDIPDEKLRKDRRRS